MNPELAYNVWGTVILVAFLLGAVVASVPGYWFKKRFYIGSHELLIKNNLLGVESIYLDGNKVVSTFAFAGKYTVKIDSSIYEVSYFYMWHLLGVGVTLRNLDTGEIVYTDK